MSLRAKKTKWRLSLRRRADRLVSRLNQMWVHTSIAGLTNTVTQELGDVAAHYYRLGRSAGIAEGRRRMQEDR